MSLLSTIGLSMIFLLVASALGSLWLRARGIYLQGIRYWTLWTPFLATILFEFIIVFNILSLGRSTPSQSLLSLNQVFTPVELVLLLPFGALFVTRMGPGAAILCALLTIFRYEEISTIQTFSLAGPYLFLASIVAVATLGDRLPWMTSPVLRDRFNNPFKPLLFLVSLGISFGSILLSVARLKGFSRWLSLILEIPVSQTIASAILYALLIGWIMIAIGQARHILLMVLSVPTTMVLAFITGSTGPMLAGFFALTLGLSLALADRRAEERRRNPNGGITMVYYGTAH